MTSPGGGAVTIGALVFGVFSWVMVSGGLTFPVANPPPGKDPPLDPEVVIPGGVFGPGKKPPPPGKNPPLEPEVATTDGANVPGKKPPPPGTNPPLEVGVVNFGGDVEFAVELALTPPELPFTVGASVTNPKKSWRLLLPHSHGDLVVVLFEGVVLLPFGLEV